MNAVTRLRLFAAGLLVVGVGAAGVGRATGPVGPVGPPTGDRQPGHGGGDAHGATAGHGPDAPAVPELPGGLTTSQDGLTLVLDRATYRPGTRELTFRVEDAEGEPVTDYDLVHDRRMHLIAVRRDFSGFQHVHPVLGDDGSWRVPLVLTAGSWRVFADFAPSGAEALTLATDLAVTGAPDLAPPAAVSRTATVDGYTVTLDGDLVAGEHALLGLTVSRDGAPVTDLEPYLGAYGHLVALREGDLAYLHVHPEDGPAGPTVEFGAEVPSPGRYHLYLDFQHDGVVRTAAFTVEAHTTGGAGHEHD